MTFESIASAGLGELINSLIADELLAAAQYKTAHIVACGKAFAFADKVFLKNGDEEYEDHVEELVDFAQSMKIPLHVNPSDAAQNCTTPYVDVSDCEDTESLVCILLDAEEKAIAAYEAAAKSAAACEYPSFGYLCSEIALDERGHKKELEDVLGQIRGCDSENSGCSTDAACGCGNTTVVSARCPSCSEPSSVGGVDDVPNPLEQAQGSLADSCGGVPLVAGGDSTVAIGGCDNVSNGPKAVRISIAQCNDEPPVISVAEESTLNDFVSMHGIMKSVFESLKK